MKQYLLLLFSILLLIEGYSQSTYLKLKSILPKDGLSQSNVNCILRDSKGLMWFGTDDGLNRYDGYNIKIFSEIVGDSTSLSLNTIKCIFEDSKNNLWVGTHGGLHLYDRKTESFKRFQHNSNDKNSISSNDVRAIIEDKNNKLWVATYGGGLNQFDYEKQRFFCYKNDPSNSSSIISNKLRCINLGPKGKIWVGTEKGLSVLQKDSGKFIHYNHQDHDEKSLVNNSIRYLFLDQNNNQWIGTFGGGLDLYNPENDSFRHFIHDKSNNNSIRSNFILSVGQVRKGEIWVGTDGGGLNILDTKSFKFIPCESVEGFKLQTVLSIYQSKTGLIWLGTYKEGVKLYNNFDAFMHFRNYSENINSLSNNNIMAITEDHNGNFWIGTDGGGLNFYNKQLNKFVLYNKGAGKVNFTLKSDKILSIIVDNKNNIWFGTYDDGLYYFDIRKNKFINYRHDQNDSLSINNNSVWDVIKDKKGNIWVATANGVGRLNIKEGSFKRFKHDENKKESLSSNDTRTLYQDIKGDIWVGTFKGLNLFNNENQTFIRFQNIPNNINSLSANGVLSITEDKHLNFWVGTYGGGLNKFDRTTNTFKSYRTSDGIANDVIYGIVEDNNDHLWLSTNKGLSKMDIRNETFENYTSHDGLQSNQFNIGAYGSTRAGLLFFGGINGFNLFDPEKIMVNKNIPPVIITEFNLVNDSKKENERNNALSKSIIETKEITLDYKEGIISLSFSALSYIAPNQNQYAFILEGFDNSWNYIGNNHSITYTSLPAGKYNFKVKASNNNGVWNEEGAQLKINILPPYWQTSFFRVIVVVFIILLMITIYKIRVIGIKQQKRKLEHLVEERTKELEHQKEQIINTNKSLLEAEHENAVLIQKQLEDELEFRNKELTTHTIHTIHKNTLLDKLRNNLKTLVKRVGYEESKEFKTLIAQIDSSFELDEDWKNFNMLFNRVHRSFFEVLHEQFDSLTSGDVRLCCLYKMNLSTKDIATILGISMNSVKVARYRLRKKLHLNPDDSLIEFLENIEKEQV